MESQPGDEWLFISWSEVVTIVLFALTVLCFALWNMAGMIPLILLVIQTAAREFTEDFTS